MFRPYMRDFVDRLYRKCAAGEATYGDKSFTTSTDAGIREVQEELVDVAGWAMVEWIKLERLRESLKQLPIICAINPEKPVDKVKNP